MIGQLGPCDVVVTRLDRLGRSTRDPLNTLAASADCKGFRSLGGACVDTTMPANASTRCFQKLRLSELCLPPMLSRGYSFRKI